MGVCFWDNVVGQNSVQLDIFRTSGIWGQWHGAQALFNVNLKLKVRPKGIWASVAEASKVNKGQISK